MFGWLKSTCPVDRAPKEWLEERLLWLTEEFDSNAFTDKPVVLPTPEFFPDPYDGSKSSVRDMLDRICGYMGIVSSQIALRFFTEPRNLYFVNEHGEALPAGAAGLYEEGKRKFIVRIEASQLSNPSDLVGTIAHELAHVLLLGEGRVLREQYDNELLTDLTALFHGFGIFLANSPRNWAGQYSCWPGTDLRKPEYMTPPMFGYALAHLAWHLGEEKPSWAKQLRMGARANLSQGLQYLQKTGDSAFKPWHLRLGK